MRKNIVFLLIFTILINTSFIYADNTNFTVHQQNQVFDYLKQEFDYDEKTDTYYFPTNNNLGKEGRSASVAVGGTVVSAVLALAVKAGLEFATTNSLSEFVSRFFMLDGISSVVDGLSGAIKNSVGGVINFSKSLLDTVSSKFAEVMTRQKVTSVFVNGRKLPVLDVKETLRRSITKEQARYLFESSSLPKLSFDCGSVTSDGYLYAQSDILLPDAGSYGGYFGLRAKLNRFSSPYYDFTQYRVTKEDGSTLIPGSDCSIQFDRGTFSNGNTGYSIPFLYSLASGNYYVGYVVAIYSGATGLMLDVGGTLTYASINASQVTGGSVLPTIGSAWSDGKITDDEDINIKIPVDTNELVNKTPSDVDNPSYQVWVPGITIVPPVIDTGTGNPPTDSVLPPIDDTLDPPATDTDNPGTDTDNPGDVETDTPSNAWEWLKNLLELIKQLIESILGWLTSFWDNLLEFLKSLLIPKANYWIDTLSDILTSVKNKIPDIDIDLLEELAVNEKPFEDIYARFFGIECLVVRGSVVNEVISWIKPIIQGLMALFLLLYNYNQVYKLIRGGSLVGSTCVNDERGK